ANTELYVNQNQSATLHGAAHIVGSGDGFNRVTFTQGSHLTVAPGASLSLANAALGNSSYGSLTNQGLIQADGGGPVFFYPLSTTNTGVIQAHNGGTLILLAIGGPLENTGGTLQALDASKIYLEGMAINGGLLRTVDGGSIEVPSGYSSSLAGDITL